MKLEINGTYSQQDIRDLLGITIMRGMNFKVDTNRLVLVRNHVKSIYDDRQEGNIIYYTGEGRKGDQTLTATNKRLNDSNDESTEVHLFEVFNTKVYTYKGLVQLVDKPYQEMQPDEDGVDRLVYVFPLKLSDTASINQDIEIETMQKLSERKVKSLSDEELERKTKLTERIKPGYSYTKTRAYQRSQYVIESVERRAKGICELCEQEAPFKKANGKPYLEVHHIVQLAKRGPDTVKNAVALCPNCHRKMHSLELEEDIKYLQTKAN